MTYSDELREFIKAWEGGPFLQPHWDAIGKVWDIGWGHQILPDEETRDITHDEAEMLLDWDLHFFDDGVNAAVTFPIAQCQHDAVVACAYNIGLKNFRGSTLLNYINSGNFDAAGDQFMVWVKAHGQTVTGLVNRRLAERAMFEAGIYDGHP